MEHVLERHANTIHILVTVPPPRPPLPSKVRAALQPPDTDSSSVLGRQEAEKPGGFDDNFVNNGSSLRDSEGDARRATPLPESEVARLNNGEGVADSATSGASANGMLVGVA